MKNDVKDYLQKVICRKTSFKKLFFVGIFKVNDENRRVRIRIRIRIYRSEAWIRGSGSRSTPKCHGSATLCTTQQKRDTSPDIHYHNGQVVSPAYGYIESALVNCNNEGGPGPRHNMKRDHGSSIFNWQMVYYLHLLTFSRNR